MQITYLGTAAAEAWPGVFCNCAACQEAKKRGGKNIRTRSQVMINQDLMVDFPCDSYFHMLRDGVDLSGIHHLLVTHSHSDHFYPQDFTVHGGCYAHDMTAPKLNIHCGPEVETRFYRIVESEWEDSVADTVEFHTARPFEPFTAGEYRITPLPARHMHTEQALLYLIQAPDATMLYGNDSGRFYPELIEYLVQNKVHLDLVSFDCTSGPLENGEEGGHMGIPDNHVVRQRLEQAGVCGPDTCWIVTHFSHNGGLLHEELCEMLEPQGYTVAYDGMKVEISHR